MITRRTFTTLLAGMAGVAAAPRLLWSQTAMPKTVFYTSVGPEFTLFDIDIDRRLELPMQQLAYPVGVIRCPQAIGHDAHDRVIDRSLDHLKLMYAAHLAQPQHKADGRFLSAIFQMQARISPPFHS